MNEIVPLLKRLANLTDVLKNVGSDVERASIGVQVKMDSASDRLAGSLDTSIERLVNSLDGLAAAAKEGAEASSRYARQLVFATWALVAVTVALAAITWVGVG
jgi:hypothetical protein